MFVCFIVLVVFLDTFFNLIKITQLQFGKD